MEIRYYWELFPIGAMNYVPTNSAQNIVVL